MQKVAWFFFTEIQFNVNDFLEKSGKDYNGY